MKTKDRIVTASIGLRWSTIDEIQTRADKRGVSFSSEGRRLIEKALADDVQEPAEKSEVAASSAIEILGGSDAPV